MKTIGFNKPYFSGKEINYIEQAVKNAKISGNGPFTNKCHTFFEERYKFKKCLLTTSCTDALEMAAILCNIQPGDEVIAPSYTFVSTVNAFILRGANIVFVDSRSDHPGLDEEAIEGLISPKTKVLIAVHYAGVACDMDKILDLSKKYNLFVVEDAAQAIDAYYTSKNGKRYALGSLGHFAAFSFHETKNIISGEGGMLVINDSEFFNRAEVIWEKGTNRSAFNKGEIDKYCWMDIGSSFLMSEINAAFLWAQLEKLDYIQEKRTQIWDSYYEYLLEWSKLNHCFIPTIPNFASNNAHMFYLVFEEEKARTFFIENLKKKGMNTVFHYQSLHTSPYYLDKHDGRELLNADRYSNCLVRLPFYVELEVMDAINLLLKK